jgi:hypothetical protein
LFLILGNVPKGSNVIDVRAFAIIKVELNIVKNAS